MKARMEELQQKLEALQKAEEEKTAPAAPVSSSLLNPDITLLGNATGHIGSDKGDPDRDRLRLDEIELGIQSRVYPDIRADMFVGLGREEDFKAELEEGYLTFLRLGNSAFGARVGKMLTPIGKVNTLHPHSWLYIDRPAPLNAFFGDHGLTTNGAMLSYMIPTPSDLFARLELGLWDSPAIHAHEHEAEERAADEEESEAAPGLGTDRALKSARLWLSRALGEAAELEFGTSYLWGKAPEYEGSRDKIDMLAFDMTYRRWPGAFSRVMFQGEYFSHRRRGAEGGHRRNGYYLFAGYKPGRYWEYGLRYDWTAFPYPMPGRENSLSAILTHYLNETTCARLQLKRGSRPSRDNFTEFWLQLIFGAGPHSHPLQ
ncbi:MAG: hypothetical protein IT210_10130 [Armatimonadetes bacterium]|nr:hypothetical protein [Armatimonadota bacterium]